MPAYEIALPPGAKNIKIKTSTQEIPVEPTFYRHSKDGAIPIIALFGGDEFVGEVLEGQWNKEQMEVSMAAFISNGKLNCKLGSDSDGIMRRQVLTSKSRLPLLNEIALTLEQTSPISTSSEPMLFGFMLSDEIDFDPDNCILIGLAVSSSGCRCEVWKREDNSWDNPWNSEYGVTKAYWKIEVSSGQIKIYCDEGQTGSWGSPVYSVSFDFLGELVYVSYRSWSKWTSYQTFTSDFVRVTYPDFKVVYDLDDDAYQGEGEELLKKAWDTSGNGNHGTVYNAKWVKIGSEKGLEFDGDDKVIIPHSESLNLNELTVACRFKSTFSGEWFKALVAKFGDALISEAWGLGWLEANRLGFWIRDATNTENKVFCNVNEGLDGETHTIVGVASSSKVKVFLDSNKYEIDRTAGDIRNDRFVSIGYHYGQYIQDTTVLEVLIYNHALSDDEVQQLIAGNPPTSGLVGEWKFDGGNNRGEVIVWDTMNSDDEDDWVRVFDPSHKFVGDCVIENGLVRFKVELETDSHCRWGFWNGSNWTMNRIEMPSGYRKARNFKVVTIKSESASVVFQSLFFYGAENLIKVEIRRGEPYIRITNLSDDPEGLFYYLPSCRFCYAQQTGVVDKNLQTGWQDLERGIDNFVLKFSESQQFFVLESRSKNWNSQASYDKYGSILAVEKSETVHLGIIDFPKYANLFKEAEDATLSAGTHTFTTIPDASTYVTVESSDPNDTTQVVTVQGYDENGNIVEGTATLNGTTPVHVQSNGVDIDFTSHHSSSGICYVKLSDVTNGDVTLKASDGTVIVTLSAGETEAKEGAKVETTQTDDSGDSVILDAYNENVQWRLSNNPLPVGRYLIFVRVKDVKQAKNDFSFFVKNYTDNRFLNEENTYVYFTLTNDFTYYGLVFDIADDDQGDEIRFYAWKNTDNVNAIYVDYFLIVPIGNGESWPQDIAHNAMRTASVKYRVFRR